MKLNDLLNRLDSLSDCLWCVHIFGDFSGHVEYNDNEVYSFVNQEDLESYLYGQIAIREQKENNKDSVVEEVISKFKERSETGIKKYGTTLDRDDLSLDDWLNHAIEEGMDMILYLTKIRKELGERRSIQDRKD